MQIQNRQGQGFYLDTRVGSGGEAQIWAVRQQPDLVAKIYREPSPEREAKLVAMLASMPSAQQSIAWPTALLYQNRKFAGFFMPQVKGHLPIFSIYNPVRRRKLRTSFHWRHFLHHTALNLSTVVASVHASGHVVGDLNESNVLVSQRALVTLIDTDSFQICAPNGQIFRSPVGKAEFTPPELQGIDFKSVDRELVHDHFALSTLIFLLLMEGVHPFAGVPTGTPPSGRVDLYGIEQGLFPHAQNNSRIARQVTPPPGAPDFNTLHPELQQLFLNTFVNGHKQPADRASAREWRDALVVAKDALVTCKSDKDHVYSSHLGECPQCAAQRKERKREQAEALRRKRSAVFAGVRKGLDAVNPVGQTPAAQEPKGKKRQSVHTVHSAAASVPPPLRQRRKPSAYGPAPTGPLGRLSRAWRSTVPWIEQGFVLMFFNTIAFPLVFALNVNSLVLAQNIFTGQIDTGFTYIITAVLSGILLGGLQSIGLRFTLLRSHSQRMQWIGTTIIVCVIASILGMTATIIEGSIWGGIMLGGAVGVGQARVLRKLRLDVRKRRMWVFVNVLSGIAMSWLWSEGLMSVLALAVIGGSGVISTFTMLSIMHQTRFAPKHRSLVLPRRYQLRSGSWIKLPWKKLTWKKLRFWKSLNNGKNPKPAKRNMKRFGPGGRLRPPSVSNRWFLGALLPLLVGLFLIGQNLFNMTYRAISVRADEPTPVVSTPASTAVSAPPLEPIRPTLGDGR